MMASEKLPLLIGKVYSMLFIATTVFHIQLSFFPYISKHPVNPLIHLTLYFLTKLFPV